MPSIYYNGNSRYYEVDDENDLPQSNLLRDSYVYDTTVVQDSEAGRLDLVSYRVYNTPVRWWIIARSNSIINPDAVLAGTVLKIPRIM